MLFNGPSYYTRYINCYDSTDWPASLSRGTLCCGAVPTARMLCKYEVSFNYLREDIQKKGRYNLIAKQISVALQEKIGAIISKLFQINITP